MWNTLDVLASGSSQLASRRRPSLQLFPGVPDFAALGEVEQDGEKLNGAAKRCYHSLSLLVFCSSHSYMIFRGIRSLIVAL